MIGVVLWCDNVAGKAVFWCEDQGDLAYYETLLPGEAAPLGFSAGDMVQFDVTQERRMRKAHNAFLLQEKVARELPTVLRRHTFGTDYQTAPQHHSAKIIPFAPRIGPETPICDLREAGKG